jgi:hypothetical protein
MILSSYCFIGHYIFWPSWPPSRVWVLVKDSAAWFYKTNGDAHTYLLTELSPSWGAANCATTQELPSIWNPKVRHRVHRSPPLVLILIHINPIHTIPSYLRYVIILSTHVCLGLSSSLFPSGFPTNILYAFLFCPHSCCVPCPSRPSWLEGSHITKITRDNYNRRKENRITVSGRILKHNLYTWNGQLGRNMLCPKEEYEERTVNDVVHRRHKSSNIRSIQSNRITLRH